MSRIQNTNRAASDNHEINSSNRSLVSVGDLSASDLASSPNQPSLWISVILPIKLTSLGFKGDLGLYLGIAYRPSALT